ncbi:hypothetical protein QJS66_23305 (plasmid) [Kocuria rhizophila]|nr:hypothetical protein QJS66_23305 [Kocuria rhizophila]
MSDIYTQFCDTCFDKYVEGRMYNDPWIIRYYWCDIGERTPSIGRSRCSHCGDEGWKAWRGWSAWTTPSTTVEQPCTTSSPEIDGGPTGPAVFHALGH